MTKLRAMRVKDDSKDSFDSVRVLLAEDEELNRKVALTMLKRLGYNADAVVNGLEVLQALEQQAYDLILMNIVMPKMDGFETTREICKCVPAPKRPKIIAITAYILPNDKERCLDAGMDDYLFKPVTLNELAQMLSKYIPQDLAT
jgi:CheY-like chemotaxis protein